MGREQMIDRPFSPVWDGIMIIINFLKFFIGTQDSSMVRNHKSFGRLMEGRVMVTELLLTSDSLFIKNR
ncbi:MAG: hypothetical protein FD166_1984 [Bacteroidetes bacterium]|nr:MAG: hypothetical protein FD166_1984 [Bacteroidota bacterium]